MFRQTYAMTIVNLMHKAKLHIAYPKVRLQSEDLTIQLSVAGNKARQPNSINITDGKSYPSNKYFGHILPNGILKWSYGTTIQETDLISHELELFAETPTKYAKMYSSATGNCMFCAKTLTDPQSVAVGYGQICAAHFGLSHGEINQQVANDMAQIEMEMPELTSEIQHSITDNGKQELPFYDITAPKNQVQIEIREDQTVVWISVDGQTVLRICKIPKLKIENQGK